MIANNRAWVYVSAGLVTLTLITALLTFLFSGYVVTYALLPEKTRTYFFEAPRVVAAYGGQPMIGPFINYTPPNSATSYHFLQFAAWGPKGVGTFVVIAQITPRFSMDIVGITGPAGEKFGGRCGRAFR